MAEWLKATDCKVRFKSGCNLPVSIHTGCIVCKSMAYFDDLLGRVTPKVNSLLGISVNGN